MALAELAAALPAEFAVLDKMPHLISGFAPPENRGVETGEDDVVGFATEVGVGLGDHEIESGGDDANV